MHSETAPRDGKFVLLEEEDATGKYDTAPGKDHLRRGPAFSFFLSRAAAQPATASDVVIASRSVALVPATTAVGAQTTLDEAKRASRPRWGFAAFVIAANLVAVVGAGMYFGEIAYEAMIRKAAEAKAAKLQQERNRAAALASELATIRRDDTTVALSNKAGDEVTKFKQAAEKGSAELRQSLQKEQERAETLAQELAMARARMNTFEAQARQASEHAAELKQAADSAAELRTSLQQERDRASRLEQDVAAARLDVQKQTALAAKAGEEARQMKQAADSAAELQKSLEQEKERTARLEQDVAAARRDAEKQTARPAKASRQASPTKRAENSAAEFKSNSIWNLIFAPPRR